MQIIKTVNQKTFFDFDWRKFMDKTEKHTKTEMDEALNSSRWWAKYLLSITFADIPKPGELPHDGALAYWGNCFAAKFYISQLAMRKRRSMICSRLRNC